MIQILIGIKVSKKSDPGPDRRRNVDDPPSAKKIRLHRHIDSEFSHTTQAFVLGVGRGRGLPKHLK
jgi:hypothetical protein